MNIEVNDKSWGLELRIQADNVDIEEDISHTLYGKKEDGSNDYSKCLGKDVADEFMDMFTKALDDIVYCREKEYDSSGLIEALVEKLPIKEREKLLKVLKDDYGEDE